MIGNELAREGPKNFLSSFYVCIARLVAGCAKVLLGHLVSKCTYSETWYRALT